MSKVLEKCDTLIINIRSKITLNERDKMQEFNMTHKTLDMKKIMVIVKGEDKTAEIEKMKYVSEPGKIGIKYFLSLINI